MAKQKLKIVLVEDERDLVETITMFLETRGFSVITALDGRSGLDLIIKEKPDVVILDIMLPEMDGRDVLKNLKDRQDTKGIPVIVLSARGQQFERIDGLGLGAYEYISKPYDREILLRQINNVVHKRKDKAL